MVVLGDDIVLMDVSRSGWVSREVVEEVLGRCWRWVTYMSSWSVWVEGKSRVEARGGFEVLEARCGLGVGGDGMKGWGGDAGIGIGLARRWFTQAWQLGHFDGK